MIAVRFQVRGFVTRANGGPAGARNRPQAQTLRTFWSELACSAARTRFCYRDKSDICEKL